MLFQDELYKEKVMTNIFDVYNQDLLPRDHVNFLENVLYKKFNIQPQVIYDIGSCTLHWERHASRIWKDSKIYVFDAFSPLEELYRSINDGALGPVPGRIKKVGVNYNMCCLSNVNDLDVKFYQSDFLFGGNSIFKEKNDKVFPPENFIVKKTITLDTLVEAKNLPYPDLIKMDIQGNELNALKGATQVLKCCSYLILELQEVEYNEFAPQKYAVIEYLKSIGFVLFCENFSRNIADSDSCFVNVARTNIINNSLN